MENWELFVKKTIELIGFKDFRVEVDNERNRGLVFIYDSPALVKENLAQIVESLNYVVQMAAKRINQTSPIFDVNNYRQERENLIVELAKAAAKKVLATGENIALPVMNSYERRLIHMALAIHPEVTTESAGLSKERHVIIKLIK